MPDKAVDLMDEAASSLRLQQESKPDAIEALDRRIIQRKIEVEGLRRETDKSSITRRGALEAEIAEKERELGALMEKWNAEKKALQEAKAAKERLEAARRELESAEVRIGKLTLLVLHSPERRCCNLRVRCDDSVTATGLARPS
jgi:ATP-dependent Clp protease ATP-binding subunit ClpB